MSELNFDLVFERYEEEARRVRRFFPGAVLAGGAVRDTLLGRPVKDRDYFVTQPVTPDECEVVFGQPFHHVLIKSVMYSAPDGGSSLKYVLESEDKSINVLVVESVEKKVESFPDDISMVFFNGSNVVTTAQFNRAVNCKCITFAERSRATRLHRLEEKYANEYVFNATDEDIIK